MTSASGSEQGSTRPSDRDVRITAVTADEILGGAVSLIGRRKKERRDAVPAFRLFRDPVAYLGRWEGLILPYDSAADKAYRGLPARLRQEFKDDARIAAVVMASGATVWTCNVADFARISGLAVVRAETGSKLPNRDP